MLTVSSTWVGEEGEQWSSVQGLESVLLSIQSLMSARPYENEPGFENDMSDNGSDLDSDVDAEDKATILAECRRSKEKAMMYAAKVGLLRYQ